MTIRFDGIAPEQLGCVKTLSVTDHFEADVEHQTVVRRGRIIASVRVPTVRKIDVTLLARARGKEELENLLGRVHAWLLDPGESELEVSGKKGVYYKARCTDIEPPEYSGPTARVSAAFSCVDYRPYNRYNHLPVDGADPPSDNFTFAGKHCLNDMHCMFVLDSMTMPDVSPHKYSVSGRPGTIRYDAQEIALGERQLSGSLHFVGDMGEAMSGEAIASRQHEVASWLILSGRAPLIFDSDITRAYQAELEQGASFSCADWENGKLSVKLTLQPEAADVQPSSLEMTLALSANAAQSFSLADAFPRGLGYPTPLVVEITNTGASAIADLRLFCKDRFGAYAHTRFYGNGFSLAAGQTLKIDGENALFSIGGVSAARYLESGSFPSVSPPPGVLALWVRTGAASSVRVRVTAKARWI